MLDLNIDNILKHLQKKGFDANFQTETKQVYLVFKVHNLDFPLFIRVFNEQDLLQLLVFMPCSVKEESLNDCARLLHLLNKELDIPGFGMDESAGVLFYRLTLPLFSKQIDETLLEGFITSMQGICESLYPVIENVATGALSFENALKKAGAK